MFNKQIRKLPGKDELASIAAAFGTDDLIANSTSKILNKNEVLDVKTKSSSIIGLPGSNDPVDDSSSYLSTDFQTADENQSNDQNTKVYSSRRGSFDATSSDVNIDTESTSEADVSSAEVQKADKAKSDLKFNPKAMPYFKPTTTFVP